MVDRVDEVLQVRKRVREKIIELMARKGEQPPSDPAVLDQLVNCKKNIEAISGAGRRFRRGKFGPIQGKPSPESLKSTPRLEKTSQKKFEHLGLQSAAKVDNREEKSLIDLGEEGLSKSNN